MQSQLTRIMWPESEQKSEDRGRPLCSSDDGRIGHGVPGGNCGNCSLKEFGSNGEAPACDERLSLYVWLPDEQLIVFIDLPPTSVTDAKKSIKHMQKFADLCVVPVRISLIIVKRGKKEFPK